MIDVKELQEWASRCSGYCMMEISPDRILALCDRLEAAEKDAERYRWLRVYYGEDLPSATWCLKGK